MSRRWFSSSLLSSIVSSHRFTSIPSTDDHLLFPKRRSNGTMSHDKGDLPVAQAKTPQETGSDGDAVGAAVKAVKAGHAGDVDIAARILAEYGGEGNEATWTDDEEKKLIRKVDWMIVPILFVCATLSGLDKTAISAAAIYGLKEDLNLTGAQYSWLGSAPFFGGLLFMGPSAYLVQKLPAVLYFSVAVLCWGLLACCMAACSSFGAIFTCRFLLGGFEALLIPAVTLITSMWYKPEEQPRRNSIILNVIAPILNGFIAWVVGYYNGSFAPWKIIFLLVGCATLAWSAVVYLFLPSNPLEARWLSPREKYIIIQRKAADNTGIENKHFKIEHVKEAFLDAKTWLIWFAIIALQVPNGGLTTFNTLIISGLGFGDLQTSLLAMPPGAMSTVSGIVLSYLASTTRKYRTPLVAVSILLPLLGALLCYNLPRDNLAGQLIGLYILYTYWAPYVTLVSVYQANVAGHTKKVTLYAWFYVSWAVGNIIGPQTFREDQAPAYTGGTVAMIVCYVVAMVLVLLYGALCWKSNRDRVEVIESELAADQDWLDLTDKKNGAFKYTT